MESMFIPEIKKEIAVAILETFGEKEGISVYSITFYNKYCIRISSYYKEERFSVSLNMYPLVMIESGISRKDMLEVVLKYEAKKMIIQMRNHSITKEKV